MTFELHLGVETVGHLPLREPICVTPDTTVRDALARLASHRRGCLLICRDDRLMGIFTERDALPLMADGGDFDQPIENVMHSDVACISNRDRIGQAIERMSVGGYRRLPVVDEKGRPQGILTTRELLRYLVEHFPTIVYTLPPDPHHLPQTREGA